MNDFLLKIDTILIGLIALGGIILKIIDEAKRAVRIRKIDAKNDEILNQVRKNQIFSLRAVIYINAPGKTLETMEAFLEYIKLGGNHSTVDWTIMNILKDNQELWWSVVEKYKYEDPTNPQVFNESMDKIRKSLH